jgi:GNAT superfamily N-acetyltransferase
MDSARQDLEIVFDPLPAEALSRFVSESVISANIAHTGVSDWHPVGFFLKSPRGEWLGGLTGYIWGGWLHVNFLWVSEALRGQRYGTRLMDAAEEMAKERGAVGATLETFTSQAPDFYDKRGYSIFGRIDDYPPGHAKLFLTKRLNGGKSGFERPFDDERHGGPVTAL